MALVGVGLRQIEGMTEALSNHVKIPKVPSYTQISRRFNKLGLDIISSLVDPEDGQTIAIDSTGIKLDYLVEEAQKYAPVIKVLEDGAYDTYDNGESLDKKGIKPIIKLRKDSIPNGLNRRAREVRKIKKIAWTNGKKKQTTEQDGS